MSFWSFILDKTAGGTLKAAGEFAKDIRTAITGNDPISSEMKFKLMEQAAALEAASEQAQVEIQKAQIEVNKTEAASTSLFKGGWRPAVGWTCVSGLFYQMVIRPILPWLIGLWTPVPLMPSLELDTLLTLLFGILGLGAYRTYERVKQ